MNIFKTAVVCILLVICLGMLRKCAEQNGDNSEKIATVELKDSGETSVSLAVPKGQLEPWRLQFDSNSKALNGQTPNSDNLAVYLRNDDAVPMVVLVTESITIKPGESIRIFDGPLEKLLLVGRTSQEELTLKTTRERPIKITLVFKHGTQYQGVNIDVIIWFLSYGL